MGRGAASSRIYDSLAVTPGAGAGGRRSVDLDALRAIAALLVVGNHTTIWGGPPYPVVTDRSLTTLVFSGGGGLSLFFALSGFLIAGPFLKSLITGERGPNTRNYAVRRAARILPAYWVALAAAVLLLPHQPLTWWQLPLHVGLLHNFVPGEAAALFVVAWTLSLEAQFYVFVPVATAAARRIRRGPIDIDVLARGVLLLWAAVVVWGVVLAAIHPGVGKNVDVLRLSLPGLLSGFCPGLLVFLAETEEAASRGGAWALYRRIVRRPALVFALAALTWLAGALATSSTTWVVVDLGKHLQAIASGLALAGFCQGFRMLRVPARVLAPIGLVSYGVYLWHWIVVNAAVRFGLVPWEGHGTARYLLHYAVIVSVTLVVATASWLLVERPIIRSALRAVGRRPPSTAFA